MKKILILLAALTVVTNSVFAMPQASEAIGSLPAQVQAQSGTKHKVKAGESHTNEAGVTLTNDKNSRGNATIDPKKDNANGKTAIDTRTGFKGSVSGATADTTIDFASSNEATVSGQGCRVKVSGNCTITIVNTAEEGDADGDITVELASGATITVEAGSRTTIET